MEADGNIINRYTYRGEEGEVIPLHATHVFVTAKVIRAWAFRLHPNIIEVICHEDVETIEEGAFSDCPRLRRVIMPGVLVVEAEAFCRCKLLMDVECGKLESIGNGALCHCKSLISINLPSVRFIWGGAFQDCKALTDATFGTKLFRSEEYAFLGCTSLERIAIPLKDGMFPYDDTFQECEKLKHVDLVEGGLHKIIAALHLERWRNRMNEEIDSISQTLPTADAGYYDHEEDDGETDVAGEKAIAIRTWIRSLVGKILHHKAEHRRLLDEDVVPTLQRFVPQDIVMNDVLPFLDLPSYTFE